MTVRLLLAIACLSASPAIAQRLDTRRIDVKILPDGGHSCHFAAIPGLQLGHDDIRQNALLNLPAEATGELNPPHLSIFYKPEANLRFGVSILGPGIDLAVPTDEDAPPFVLHGRVRVDGRSGMFAVEGKQSVTLAGGGAIYSFDINEAQSFANALAGARTVAFELLADDGTISATYRWDVHLLAGIPELLDAVQWSCISPDPA